MATKLNRATLAEQVAESLLEYIRDHGLKPGASLPSEGTLVADFDVSRPVIREALKYLEGRGVIEVTNGKGAVLKPITHEPLSRYFQMAMHMRQRTAIELMEVRRGLEVEAAALAALRRTPEDLEKMAAQLTQMRAHLQDPQTYVDLDVELHQLIAAASHNEMLFHVIRSIRSVSKDVVMEGLRRWLESSGEIVRVQELHQAVFAAIEKGDAQAASEAMIQHFDEAVTKLAGEPTADKFLE